MGAAAARSLFSFSHHPSLQTSHPSIKPHSYYISRHSLHTLPDVGLMRFRDEVYLEVRAPARDAVLAAIAAERAGDPVDRPLLKNVLSIAIEVGMGALDYYEADFEGPILEATADHYSRVAAAWVEADSCPDYMAKAEACLTVRLEIGFFLVIFCPFFCVKNTHVFTHTPSFSLFKPNRRRRSASTPTSTSPPAPACWPRPRRSC